MFDPILGDILAMDEMIDRKAEKIAKERGIKDPIEARMEAIADTGKRKTMNSFKEVKDIVKAQLSQQIEDALKDEYLKQTGSEASILIRIAHTVATGYVPDRRSYEEVSAWDKAWDRHLGEICNTLKVIEGLEKLSQILD